MKKFFYLMSAAVALFGMAACDKSEIEEPATPNVEKSNFVLYADIATESRTTLDGKKVDWADGDMLYLVTSDATWGQPYVSNSETNAHTIAQYKYSNGAFEDNSDANLPKLTDGTAYTVYAMYTPGQMSYHRAAASTHLLAATQMQDCTNPTAHIAANDAMVGKFTVTPPATSASVSMSHLYTMMEVDVKNNTGADLTISQFEIEAANAELSGTFTVGFANSPINITNSKNTTNKICVKVANGAVAAGASLPIYFVMAPLADYSGDVTFTVTDSNGYTYTQTKTLSNASFAAGKYNKTGYTISEGVAPVDYSGTYVIMQTYSGDGNYRYVSAADGSSGNNRKAVETGVSEIPSSLNAIPSMCNAARWIIAKVDGETTYTLQSADNEKYIYGASTSSNYAKLTTNAASAEKVNIQYDAVTETYTIESAATGKYLSLNTSIYAFYKSSYDHALTFVSATTPLLDLSAADVQLEAAAANGTADVTLANNEGWTVTVSNNSGGWLTTNTALNSSNQVVYSVTANTGEAREATVTLTATKATESKVVTFTVSQDTIEDSPHIELTSENMSNMTDAGTGYGTLKYFTSDNYTWTTNGYQTGSVKTMIQLRKKDHNSGTSYIKLPELASAIKKITLTVTSTTTETSTGTASTALYEFIEGGAVPTKDSEAVVSGGDSVNGANEVVLDLSSYSHTTGYIVLAKNSGGTRIWNIRVDY